MPVAEATHYDDMDVQHNGTAVRPTLVPKEIKVENLKHTTENIIN